MKKILTLIVCIFFLPAFALATDSPKAVVQEMVTKLKEAGNPVAIVDYVHWQSAFDSVDMQQRQIRNINSPEELRAQYVKLFNDPNSVFREQMDRMKSQMPPEQQKLIEGQMGQAEAMLQQMMAEMKQKLATTEFTVGEEEISGDTAQVQLTTKSEDKTETNKLKLVKVGDKWLLATLDTLNKSGGTPAGGPAGAPVAPTK